MSIRGPLSPPTPVSFLRGPETETIDAGYLAGEGAAMRRVRSQLQRIAPYFRVALITGEPGTGKETVARALHKRSARALGPFVVWRSGDFTEKLREENLTPDTLRDLRRGTLYLDCIGAMSLRLQGRLLDLLEQEAVRSQRSELRIVASNDRELRTLATTGRMREELYRRIAAVEIGLTPLRRRAEDIPLVVETLLRHIPGSAGIAPEAMLKLTQHEWPANVRELRKVLEIAAGLAEGFPIEAAHLPPLGTEPETSCETDERSLERLQDVIQRHVLEVLTRCSGNKLRASEVLGISRSTLYRMLDASEMSGGQSYPG